MCDPVELDFPEAAHDGRRIYLGPNVIELRMHLIGVISKISARLSTARSDLIGPIRIVK